MQLIVYVDMDAFYLSCELIRHPELVGSPAVVAHDPKDGKGRGVVLSASYEARALGFRSAMPVKEAWRQKDKVAWLLPDFPFYEATSGKVMHYLRSRSSLARALSIDEAAYPIDVEGVKEAELEARAVQREIRDRFSLSSSIGVASSLTVAKVASDKGKPGGIVVVAPENIASFLAALPVRALPGVGPVTESALKKVGAEKVEDLKRVPFPSLVRAVGSMARSLVMLAEGRTPEEEWPEELPPKSVGSMVTFDEDLVDESSLLKGVASLGETLGRSLQEKGSLYRTVTLRIRWEDLSSVQRSRTIPHPTSDTEVLTALAQKILREIFRSPERSGRGVRTLGLTVQGLHPQDPAQRTLPQS
jgi:nucleotidyltransferase/DNA polymerase involved in DNA repair